MDLKGHARKQVDRIGLLLRPWSLRPGQVGAPPLPVVGIFGKHPGWADHLALPLESVALREFRRVLYNTGIRAVIERGIWSEWEASGQAIPFEHSFLSGGGRSWIVGRLWASVDQIGRREYPMVVCVHFPNVGAADAVTMAGAVLERLETACRNANTAQRVLAAMNQARDEILAQWGERVRATSRESVDSPLRPIQHSISRTNTEATEEQRSQREDRFCFYLRGLYSSVASVLTFLSHKSKQETCTCHKPPINRLNFQQRLAGVRRGGWKIGRAGVGFLRNWGLYARWRVVGPAALRVAREGAEPLLQGNQIITERAGSRCWRLVICPREREWVDLIFGRPRPLALAVLRRSSRLPDAEKNEYR